MIGLYRGVSPFSRAVQFFTRSPYSHASWVKSDGSVLEAWRAGVTHEPSFNNGHTAGTLIEFFDFRHPLSADETQAIEGWLMAQVGRRYDWWSVLGFLTRRPRVNNVDWFCSELIFAACRQAGRELLARIEPWQVYPGLLSFSPLLVKVDEVRTF
jgi:uncharacterized protein YycO